MTIYVSVPQVPLTLKFEEPIDQVAEHMRQLVDEGTVYAFELGEGERVLVNFAVIACVTVHEGSRALEVGEIHSALKAKIT